MLDQFLNPDAIIIMAMMFLGAVSIVAVGVPAARLTEALCQPYIDRIAERWHSRSKPTTSHGVARKLTT